MVGLPLPTQRDLGFVTCISDLRPKNEAVAILIIRSPLEVLGAGRSAEMQLSRKPQLRKIFTVDYWRLDTPRASFATRHGWSNADVDVVPPERRIWRAYVPLDSPEPAQTRLMMFFRL